MARVGTLVLLLHEQSGELLNLHRQSGKGAVQGLEYSSWACMKLCWVEGCLERPLLPFQMTVLVLSNLVGGGVTFALEVGVAEEASCHHRQWSDVASAVAVGAVGAAHESTRGWGSTEA